jgi:hypothetical protein
MISRIVHSAIIVTVVAAVLAIAGSSSSPPPSRVGVATNNPLACPCSDAQCLPLCRVP